MDVALAGNRLQYEVQEGAPVYEPVFGNEEERSGVRVRSIAAGSQIVSLGTEDER